MEWDAIFISCGRAVLYVGLASALFETPWAGIAPPYENQWVHEATAERFSLNAWGSYQLSPCMLDEPTETSPFKLQV